MSGKRIQFRTTSCEQYRQLQVYAEIKGFKDLPSYALYAAVTMMSKNPLTEAQKAKADKLLAELE